MIEIPHEETHAYSILHVDKMDIQTRKIVAANTVPVKNNTSVMARDKLVSAFDRKNDASLSSLYDPFHFEDSTGDSSGIKSHAQLMHEARQVHDDKVVCVKDQWEFENHNRQYAKTTNDNNNEVINVQTLPNVDHVYEEIKAIKPDNLCEYDNRNCYKSHNSITAKNLVDNSFFPQHESYKECTKVYYSPVYTDRLIYEKKSLFAIEVTLCQRDNVSCFNYCNLREGFDNIFRSQQDDRYCGYMLVYSYKKTNTAGIFYSNWWPQDVFDLESELKPNIYVINRTRNTIMNTQLYHRHINNYYMRISKFSYAPMTFYRDCAKKRISCNNDLQDSLIDQTHQRRNYNIEQRRNRSSLLSLEPLLPTSELTGTEYGKSKKNQSERAKMIKVVTAYTLSFFILMSITFYVVYFT